MTQRQSTQLYSTAAETQNSPTGGDLYSSAFATQDLAAIRTQLDGINASAETVSAALTKAFTSASASSRSFSSTLQVVTASLTQMLSSAGSGLLGQGLSSILTGMVGGGASASVAPFADGGIVASPTFFGSGGSLGLMGERGAEAILPLARGPNGQLGVAANGGSAPSISVNIQTQDAASFRRSESQVAATLARAVARGRRGL
ncbi:MAG: phage tail tape measure protein [Hyphomicrobiales bacterium]|nr:phage tail tape measure protein [Hyphomicrobiales bacterium]